MLAKCDDPVLSWLKSVEISGSDRDVGFLNVVFFVSCRKADGDRTMTDASNAAAHTADAGKAKADQAADAAQDYSRQAGDIIANTYDNAKDNAQKVRRFRSYMLCSHSVFDVMRQSRRYFPWRSVILISCLLFLLHILRQSCARS